MKNVLVVFLLLFSSAVFCQKMTYEDFKTVIPFLQKEDFKGAFEKTEALLKATNVDTSDVRAQVAYMNIYSAAGMVTLDQMDYKGFEKNLKTFVGKKLKMPGHPCIDSITKVAYSSLQFQLKKDGKMQGFTMTGNKDKTNILLFEYYDFKGLVDPEDFVGTSVRCGGVLESYEVNVNKSKVWIGRLHISEAYIRGFLPK